MHRKAAQVLADNLKKLMEQTPELSSQARVSERSGVDQRTVGRILNQENSPSVDKVEGIAKAFKLHTWQLVAPDLGGLMTFQHLNTLEVQLVMLFRRAAEDPDAQQEMLGAVNKIGDRLHLIPDKANPYARAPAPGVPDREQYRGDVDKIIANVKDKSKKRLK